MKLAGKIQTVSIDEVKPYWRNPRKIPEVAIQQLSESIRQYGMQQPIVVDEDQVIIVGHTRYAALRRLKAEKIPVLIADHLDEKQRQEYRVMDNRTAEFTSWDMDKLMSELREADSTLVTEIFVGIDQQGIERVEADTEDPEWLRGTSDVEFLCPNCFHEWVAAVTRADVMSGRLSADLAKE